VSPLVGPSLGLSWRLAPKLALEAQAAGLAFGPHLERAPASADLRAGVVAVGASVVPFASSWLELELGARLGALVLAASGDAPPPLVAASTAKLSALGLASAGVALRPGSKAVLRARIGAGYSPATFAIVLGNQTAAEARSPWLEAELAAAWEW
jgi:hypothetical protein